MYTSDILSSTWGKGYATVGEVTFESAAYIARYVMKKVTGDEKEHHYAIYDRHTGEHIANKKPEYITMSRGRRPDGGLGYRFYQKYGKDIFPDDFIVLKGKKLRPPNYYSNLYQHENPDDFEILKSRRKEKIKKHKKDLTPARLVTREKCLEAKLKNLPRHKDI